MSFLSEQEQVILEGIVYNEIKTPVKKPRNEKRRIKKMRKLAHRGTNWKTVAPKPGFKRVKIGNMYIRTRMSANEKATKKLVGRVVGTQSQRLKG